MNKKGQFFEGLFVLMILLGLIGIFHESTKSSYDDFMDDCKEINKDKFQYLETCRGLWQPDKNITCHYTNHNELKEYCHQKYNNIGVAASNQGDSK